jgi:protease-4
MKKSGCFGVVLFLALCVSMLGNLVLFGLLAASTGSKVGTTLRTGTVAFEEEVLVAGGPAKVAVIPVLGLIAFSVTGPSGASMVEEVQSALHQAMEDPSVVAVVLAIDSPGGEITASDVLYHSVKEAAERKPVVAFFNSIGTSGAYYLACGASEIWCHPTTFTGSIGVIISTLNYRDLFGKVGLQSVIFKSGEFKDMLNGAREITPEEAAYVQSLVMQSYDRFLGIVAESRDLSASLLRRGPADGRILSGTDAYEEKLVDGLGYVRQAYAKAMELAEVENATIVRYEPTFSLANFFRLFGEVRERSVEVNLWKPTFDLEPGRFYLLPPMLAQ